MSMSERDEKRFKKLLGEVVCEYCPNQEGYCIFKEILLANGTSERTLMQLKCVEIFKLLKSQELCREIKWPEAWMMWADLKYAEKFAMIYDANPDLNYKEIYKKTMESK